MPTPRRFSEREIREVFERAAAQQQAASQPSEGLTLAEMQEVAASAGIAPELVAQAAQAVALGEPEQGRTTVGPVPTGVYHTEPLPVPPSDDLWAGLTADLRRTFDAEGKTRAEGPVREWRNGNLRATLEPAGAGSRLSLRTRRDGAASGAVNGSILMILGVLAVAVSLVGYGDVEAALNWLWMVLGGGLLAAAGWTRQRSWARTRQEQMEAVAARAGHAAAPLPTEAFLAETTGPAGGLLLDLDALVDPLPTDAARARPRTRS